MEGLRGLERQIAVKLEDRLPVQSVEAKQAASGFVEMQADDAAAGGGGEGQRTAFQADVIAIRRRLFVVIDLARRPPRAFESTFREGQEAENRLQAVRGQREGEIRNPVVEHVGPHGRPADNLVGNLDRGARGLQNAYASDRGIDFGKDVLGTAACQQGGKGKYRE